MQKHFQYFKKRIGYRIFGEGQPVILVHGFGEDGLIWQHQIDFLENHFKLIVPDLPGTGLSERIVSEDLNKDSDIQLEDYAAVINAILIEEQIEECILIGHSMGGYITLAFEALYPDKVLKFGLIHSTAFADSDEKKTNRLKGIELMEMYGAAPFLKNTIPNLFGAEYKKENKNKVSILLDATPVFNTLACQQYYRVMMQRPDRTSVLKGNKKPILFVIGTEDIAAPMADMLLQSKMPLNPSVHILENVGHMGMWEASEKLNQIIKEFIER